MQISSGTGLATMSGAQVALRLLNTPTAFAQKWPEAQANGDAAGDVNSLLAYAKVAKTIVRADPVQSDSD